MQKVVRNCLKPGLVNFQNNQKLVCELKSKIPEVSSLVPDPKACGTISELGSSLLWSFVAPREDYDDETNIVFNVYNGDHNGEDYDDKTDVIDDHDNGDKNDVNDGALDEDHQWRCP